MKTIPTANESFTPLLNLYSAFRPLNVVENYTKKYGDFYRLKVSNNNSVIVVSNPQAVKEIFTASPNIFKSASVNKFFHKVINLNHLFYEMWLLIDYSEC